MNGGEKVRVYSFYNVTQDVIGNDEMADSVDPKQIASS